MALSMPNSDGLRISMGDGSTALSSLGSFAIIP